MKKIKIMPKVVVYKELLSNEEINEMLTVIKDSENTIENYYAIPPEESSYRDKHGIQPMEKDDVSIINSWTPWYTYGSKTILNNRGLIVTENLSNKKEFIMKQKIVDLLRKVHKDYMSDEDHIDGWPYGIKSAELTDNIYGSLGLGVIEILKHKMVIHDDLAI